MIHRRDGVGADRGRASRLVDAGSSLEALITLTRLRAASVIACGAAAAILSPAAAADPGAAAPEAVAACTQFAYALDLASLSYSDFANALAMGEVNPDYADPVVKAGNTSGRTGLRHAVTTALDASRTPDLAPEISAPMRAWSLGATKLLVMMGLRGDVDRFNSTATQLNEHTEAVQSACAAAGTLA